MKSGHYAFGTDDLISLPIFKIIEVYTKPIQNQIVVTYEVGISKGFAKLTIGDASVHTQILLPDVVHPMGNGHEIVAVW